ncbi:TPA: hypothetical protein ACQQX6_004303 [Yersinia enterocolitica]|nr:hypothetical protein [Yersinia enterocolitica]HDL6523864.1 hypothetical protein [Yersinia enterocolitica]HDZ9662512.1 hypothetical protein [Yersinia enterocolitica]HEM6603756.1 hypothetical protein [Yersinia enterocolitica]HEN3538688.1 hypothetical protein [Yersinia enterocolitica]
MNNIEELKSAYRDVELTARNMRGKPEEYRVVTGFCPVNVVEMQAQKIQALIAQLEAAQKERDDLREKVNQADSEWQKMADRILAVGKRAETAEAALSAVQLDATRWRALLSSPAIRILGHAGLQDDKPIDGHYCHFGMEIWSHYEPYYDNKKAGELITRYADNMIASSLVEGNADAE